MSPDVFLSQHQIRYRDDLGLSPAEFVASLKVLSATRTLDGDGNLIDTIYQTEGLVWNPPAVPASIDNNVLLKEEAARQRYSKAEQSGNLAGAHAAVDQINKIRAQLGIRAFSPPTDFEIISNGASPLAQVGRSLNSDRVAFASGSAPWGSPIPWFDTAEGFKALADYAG